MSQQDVNDIQIVIDKLFEKLDNAKSGGEITQYNHSLRVQITRKRKLGGTLTERERDIIAAVGAITEGGKRIHPFLVMILILLVLGGLYVAYRYLEKSVHL